MVPEITVLFSCRTGFDLSISVFISAVRLISMCTGAIHSVIEPNPLNTPP